MTFSSVFLHWLTFVTKRISPFDFSAHAKPISTGAAVAVLVLASRAAPAISAPDNARTSAPTLTRKSRTFMNRPPL